MNKFNSLYQQLMEDAGGKPSGKLEMVKTPVDKAYNYAKSIMPELDQLIPNFKENYIKAQNHAKKGTTKRKDMPVISSKEIDTLQNLLAKGSIDNVQPYGKLTNPKNPFPQGLSGKDAENFLKGGLKIHDGNDKDDVVKVTRTKIQVDKLDPIQQQIYLDKAITGIERFGIDGTTKMLNTKYFVISNDNKIIDGHHRYLSGILINPKMNVQVLKINMPMKKLLELSLAFSDAIGNTRNL